MMDIATLTNSLKALFGTAASSTAIASTDLVPFMNSSGTPSGLSSISQLASVLGGAGLMPISNTIETIDCNNVTTTGWKRLSSSSTNTPTGMSHGARLLHFVHDNGYNMQLIFNRAGDLYTRAQNNGTWSSWQQVYDTSLLTNSTLLSPLASALGANYAYPALYSAADFNDYTHTGVVLVYTMAIQAGIQNAPTGIAYGYLEIKKMADGRIRQEYTKWVAASYFAYRSKEDANPWSDWAYV